MESNFHNSFILILFFYSPTFTQAQENVEEKSIIEVITNTYIEPLYQGGTIKKIKEGFHKEFNIYVLYNGQFSTRTRDEWIGKIEEVRARNLPKKNYSWDFTMIDIEGQTAIVKLLIQEDGKLKYIDYLTLYKFEEGWKVITKQFSMY